MAKAFDGIRVLDFTTMAAGPFCTSMLGEYGAEVIKIDPPGGEGGRVFPGMADGQSLGFACLNRAKKSVEVDLKSPEGLAFIKKLIPDCQVVLESGRPGVMKKLGLDYEAVKKIRPDVIYGSLSTYGQNSIYSQKPGYDIIAQAMSGLMDITGEADGPPEKNGSPIGDMVGGLNFFSAVATALYHWKATGEGQFIDVALVRTLIFINSTLYHCNWGRERMSSRQGNHHKTMTPYGLFRCREGNLIIGAASPAVWERLCRVMGREDWLSREEYKTLDGRAANQKEIIKGIEDWLQENYANADEAQKVLEEADVACAQVYNGWQVFNEPEFRRLGWIRELETMPGMTSMPTYWEHFGNADMTATPPVYARPPLTGEHTEEILKRYGYTDEEIEKLRKTWSK